MLDHFSRSELACPTTDELRLATGFGEALERLRVELDAPIYLTSACRSPTHNARVDGHPRSLHLTVNGH
ncbi:MAG: D-Ala-D-Ala carboxypeptidase family metallohydrolase, partial [Alphaproteobacteria bacterium]|nr:D-Ala-D-Ala carboxypeptidase family metallohydrolase [Alphaproteobacteria bacterium]